MAWTAPMTAVANEVWTATQYNTHVRDNLNATETGVASGSNQLIMGTAANAVAPRTPGLDFIDAAETTSSTSNVALATAGPAVTVTTGTAALVGIFAKISNNGANNFTLMTHAVSGATTIAASDEWALYIDGINANIINRVGVWHMHTALTAGSNTFTALYRVQAGTGTFEDRQMVVIPL